MSWWNNLHKAALPPFLFSLTFLTGCIDQHIDILKGDPQTSQLKAHEALDTAEFLCKFNRRGFPNWFLWPEYQQYLNADEKEAIQYVSNRLLSNIAPNRRPKFLATFSFIANHTQCTQIPNDAGAPTTRDETGAIAFTFQQKKPIVPNIPEIAISEHETPQEQIARWLRAFEKAYRKESIQHDVTIVVEPSQEHYHMRSAVKKSYAEPLKEQKFWRDLDEYRLEEAFEDLSIICAQNQENCRKLRPFLDSAYQQRQSIARQFEEDVDISNIQMTNIALTGLSSYTAVQMTLTNRSSRAYSDIYFVTDENEPQRCILQSERTKIEDHSLTLNANESATAWCALNSNTKPWTQLNIWIADIL